MLPLKKRIDKLQIKKNVILDVRVLGEDMLNVVMIFLFLLITLGIALFNWGDTIGLRRNKLIGLVLIIPSLLFIIMYGMPKLEDYRYKEFLEKEYKGVVTKKYREKRNHNIPVIEIENNDGIEKLRYFLLDEYFNLIEIGDTIEKKSQTKLFTVRNKNKVDSIWRNQEKPKLSSKELKK